MACPGTQVFEQLVAGQLTPELRGQVADHAATCPSCRLLVTALVTRGGPGAASSAPLAVGSLIGERYRIDHVLGAGGMGIVVAATHTELGTRVAIKLMRDELVAHPSIVERFLREARAVVRLRTDHVCRVFDAARLPTGAAYIVMELLEGTDLARTISRKPLPQTIAVEYVLQACVALAEAHALGIIHRDLKPANLFVVRRPDGGPLVKVLDFGIAKVFEGDASLTRTRMLMGSPGYMSPEQIESARDVDVRTDIWALGVTLYELLAARLPFPAATQTEIAIKVASEPPVPLDVAPALRAIVFRCLEKQPEQRYPDVAALAAELAVFGGPAARPIVQLVGQLAGKPVALAPLAAGSLPAPALHAPAPGTLPTPATPPPAPAPAPAVGHRSRAWLLAVAGIAVLGAAIAIPLALRRGTALPADASVAAATVADAVAPAAPDAGADAPIDAPIDAPFDAPPDAAAGDAAARDTAEHTAGQTPFERQLSQGMQAARDSCRKLLASKGPMINAAILQCACMVGDTARAQQAFRTIPAGKLRGDMQRMCAGFGVKLADH